MCEDAAYRRMKWEIHEIERSEVDDKFERLKQARGWRNKGEGEVD